MTSPKKIVVVLGNGFTKAFIPEMPLVKEGFEVGTLWDKFNETCSPEAHFILKQATEFKGKEKLEKITNIEVLMTRLDNYMPYDYKRKVVQELDKLYHDLKETFVDQIKTAVSQSLNSRNGKLPDLLYKFASHCISNKIDFLTFNYDDVFDRALFEKSSTFPQCPPPTSQIGCSWHPDWGYGFYLRSVYSLLDLPTFSILGGPAMSLLKLHGSINWRVQLGTSEILGPEDLVHKENWIPPSSHTALNTEELKTLFDNHLKPEGFMVLPVLMKGDLKTQPLFRLIWGLAYEKLKRAEEVFFVGYSMPTTDMAARFLFMETLSETANVFVVNFANQKNERESIKSVYREVIPRLQDKDFNFDGASEWCKEFAN